MIKSLRSQIYHVISSQGNNISLYLHNAILLNINYVLQNIIIHQNLVIFKDHLVKICFLWEMDYSCHFCLNIYMHRKGYKNIYRSYFSWCSKIVTVFVLFFVFACLCSLKSSELSIEIQHNYIFKKMLLSLKRYLLQVFRDSFLNNCIAMTDSRDPMGQCYVTEPMFVKLLVQGLPRYCIFHQISEITSDISWGYFN